MKGIPRTASAAKQLKGLFPPVLLPLTGSGEIDFESLRRQVDYLLAGEADGLWVNGTTGDFFALTELEGQEVVAAVVQQASGRVPVIAQTGEPSTRRTIVKARRALDAGADFIAAVLPYYLDYSQVELQAHYRAVAQAVGGPVLVYHLPQMCKVSLSVSAIIELTREGVLAGIKDSSGNMEFYRRLCSQVRNEGLSLRCFNGVGALMDQSLLAGGNGLMCAIANLVPRLCKRLYNLAQAGDWSGAAATQEYVQELIDLMRLPGRANWAATVAVYKWMLQQLGAIASDQVFAPLQPLARDEKRLLSERALPAVRRASELPRNDFRKGTHHSRRNHLTTEGLSADNAS